MVNSGMVHNAGNVRPSLHLLGGFHPNDGLNGRQQVLPAWRMQLMSEFYKPFDENKSRFRVIRRDLATSNWRVDMSELMRHYPV